MSPHRFIRRKVAKNKPRILSEMKFMARINYGSSPNQVGKTPIAWPFPPPGGKGLFRLSSLNRFPIKIKSRFRHCLYQITAISGDFLPTQFGEEP